MIIGIVGCGGIARAHVRALSLIPSVKGFTFFDVNPDCMNQLSESAIHPVTHCPELETLARQSDGFIICTPNHLHVALAQEILQYRRIPFVCEKPLSTDFTSAQKLTEMAPEGSIVSFNYRYNRIVQQILSLRDTRALGPLAYFSAEFSKNSAITRQHLTWRDSSRQSKSSGALGDLSCHLLDLFCSLAESTIQTERLRVVKGTRIGKKSDGPVEVDDNGYIFGSTNTGSYFNIRASKSDPDHQLGLHLHLVFEDGGIHYTTRKEDQFTLSLHNQPGEEIVKFPTTRLIPDPPRELPYWSDSFYHMHVDWCQTLSGRPPSPLLPVLSAGLQIQAVMESF